MGRSRGSGFRALKNIHRQIPLSAQQLLPFPGSPETGRPSEESAGRSAKQTSCSHQAKADEQPKKEACAATRARGGASQLTRKQCAVWEPGPDSFLRFHDFIEMWVTRRLPLAKAPLAAAAHCKDAHTLIRQKSRCLPASRGGTAANSAEAAALAPRSR